MIPPVTPTEVMEDSAPPFPPAIFPSETRPDPMEETLRPATLGRYVGQTEITDNLRVFIQAARNRGQPLDHVLLSGPPGVGKTTLAHILAHEMNAPLRATSGPVLERQGDLAAILTSLEAGQVLFIDEIHRMSRSVEEVLYAAMEDFRLDVIIGQGPMARTVKLDLQPFTLVGATTRTGLLSSPLRDRFGIPCHLRLYSPEELREIVIRGAQVLAVALRPGAAEVLAARSRGTPRVALRLLRRVRDFAQGEGAITPEGAAHSLDRLGVDRLGLEAPHRALLELIAARFSGGPVGLSTLSAALSEARDTIEEVIEPYLLQEGLIQRTPQGRVATPRAFAHLGLTPPAPVQLGFPEG